MGYRRHYCRVRGHHCRKWHLSHGLDTLISTPPNVFFAGFTKKQIKMITTNYLNSFNNFSIPHHFLIMILHINQKAASFLVIENNRAEGESFI